MLAGGLVLLLVGVSTGEIGRFDAAAVSSRSLMSVGYLIVFGSLVGFTAYAWLLRVCTPAAVATYAYVNPIVAMLLGWLIAGEEFGPRMIIAAVIILSGVALINRAPGRSASRPDSPSIRHLSRADIAPRAEPLAGD